MATLTRLLLLALLVMPVKSMAQDVSMPIEVNVAQTNVHGLVFHVSHASRKDVAIGGFADRRISLSATYPSYPAFLAGVAKMIGGSVVFEEAVPIIINACIGDRPSAMESASRLRPIKVTFGFARMDPADIFNVIYGLDANEPDRTERVKSGPYGLVGIRVKDAPLSVAYRVLSRVSGVDIVDDGAGGLSASVRSTCSNKNVESYEAPVLHLVQQPCHRNLPPSGEAKDAKCEPLEFYKLENVVLKGYIRSNGRTIAIAETPDGLTWPLAVGDYVGRDYGKVMSVSANAVVIREIVQNPYGYIYEQTIQIDYQNNRRPLLAE